MQVSVVILIQVLTFKSFSMATTTTPSPRHLRHPNNLPKKLLKNFNQSDSQDFTNGSRFITQEEFYSNLSNFIFFPLVFKNSLSKVSPSFLLESTTPLNSLTSYLLFHTTPFTPSIINHTSTPRSQLQKTSTLNDELRSISSHKRHKRKAKHTFTPLEDYHEEAALNSEGKHNTNDTYAPQRIKPNEITHQNITDLNNTPPNLDRFSNNKRPIDLNKQYKLFDRNKKDKRNIKNRIFENHIDYKTFIRQKDNKKSRLNRRTHKYRKIKKQSIKYKKSIFNRQNNKSFRKNYEKIMFKKRKKKERLNRLHKSHISKPPNPGVSGGLNNYGHYRPHNPSNQTYKHETFRLHSAKHHRKRQPPIITSQHQHKRKKKPRRINTHRILSAHNNNTITTLNALYNKSTTIERTHRYNASKWSHIGSSKSGHHSQLTRNVLLYNSCSNGFVWLKKQVFANANKNDKLGTNLSFSLSLLC